MKKKKILIADDEEVIRNIIARGLAKEPYDLVFAVDGAEAIAKAESESPDLILLDVNMPHTDGREAVHTLRQDPKCKDIPIIMVTGLGDPIDRFAGFELGVDDYVTKPFDIDVLRRRIRSILQG